MADIAVPTVSRIQTSLTNYGIGGVAGLAYRFTTNLVGSGLVGGAVAAALAGSIVKGDKGEIIATMLGFQTGLGLPEIMGAGGSGGNGGGGGANVI